MHTLRPDWIAGALALALTAGPALAAPPARPRLGAWFTYWDLAAGVASAARHPNLLSDRFLFVIQLDDSGRPIPANPALALKPAAQPAGGAWMTVVNDVRDADGHVTRKDAAVVHALLADPKRRAEHAGRIAALARKLGFTGVDIDYENLRPEDRDRFSIFIRELAARLRPQHLRLAVTVQPKRRDGSAAGPGAIDWAAICRHADRLQIMLYPLHHPRTTPGPLATPDWIQEILAFAAGQCDPARVVPALNVGGMDWGPKGDSGISFDQARELARMLRAEIGREGNSDVPAFHYSVNGETHAVYYEDARSLMKKIDAITALGYPAVMFWSLGHEDPALLDALARRRPP